MSLPHPCASEAAGKCSLRLAAAAAALPQRGSRSFRKPRRGGAGRSVDVAPVPTVDPPLTAPLREAHGKEHPPSRRAPSSSALLDVNHGGGFLRAFNTPLISIKTAACHQGVWCYLPAAVLQILALHWQSHLLDYEAAAIGWHSRREMWTRQVASVTSMISVQPPDSIEMSMIA